MRMFRAVLLISISLVIGMFLTILFPAYRQGARLLSVQSDSMEPVFAKGDGVLLRPVSANELKVDDVVSFKSNKDSRVIISHRIINTNPQNGNIYTKGDNLKTVDDEVISSQVLGKVTHVIPRAGYAQDIVSSPLGLIALVYIPGILILISEAKKLIRRYGKPAYQLRGYSALKRHRFRVARFIDKNGGTAHNQNIILRRAVR